MKRYEHCQGNLNVGHLLWESDFQALCGKNSSTYSSRTYNHAGLSRLAIVSVSVMSFFTIWLSHVPIEWGTRSHSHGQLTVSLTRILSGSWAPTLWSLRVSKVRATASCSTGLTSLAKAWRPPAKMEWDFATGPSLYIKPEQGFLLICHSPL